MVEVVVARLTCEAQDVRGIELHCAGGGELPVFTAGAHIDVHLPGQRVCQYSLLNDPRERHRYVLGVGLAPESRGGSRYVHEKLRRGDRLTIGEPRSLFGVETSASEHLFIAGGIGITPFLSMIEWCEANSRPWRLLYCVRSRSRAAFLWLLAPRHEQVRLHVDEECEGTHADLAGFLGEASPGAHVYCCGPGALMDAVAREVIATKIPKAATHFERFSAGEVASIAEGGERPFTVVLHRSGRRVSVGSQQSILDALEDGGIPVPYSCREGLCRSCETSVLRGEVDHRDFVLSDGERAENRSMLVCVSRALSDELVLDL